MGALAIVATGTLLKFGDGASPEQFTSIPEISKLSGPAIKFDLLDSTTHDTVGGFRTYLPGLADGDQVQAELNYRPSNAVHIAVREDSYARVVSNFQMIFPDSADNQVDFSGFVSQLAPKADVGTILMASLNVKVTGEPVWS